MPVSLDTFQRVALEDPEGKWELVCGRLRNKPDMTMAHNSIMAELVVQLVRQLPEGFQVRTESPRLVTPEGTRFVPDLCVLPVAVIERLRGSTALEAYAEPLPLVVEVWSPSTGDYDVESKFPEYRRRGDLEVWRIHPRDRTLTAWRLQSDGSYLETIYRAGPVSPPSLRGVSVDLESLFAWA